MFKPAERYPCVSMHILTYGNTIISLELCLLHHFMHLRFPSSSLQGVAINIRHDIREQSLRVSLSHEALKASLHIHRTHWLLATGGL